MKFTHALLAVTETGEVLHMCGYTTEPSELDYLSLEEELVTDKEFIEAEPRLLTDSWFLISAPDELVDELNDFYQQQLSVGKVTYNND